MSILLLSCCKSLYLFGDDVKERLRVKRFIVIIKVIIISYVENELIDFLSDLFLFMDFVKAEGFGSIEKDEISCCVETLHDRVEEAIVAWVFEASKAEHFDIVFFIIFLSLYVLLDFSSKDRYSFISASEDSVYSRKLDSSSF
jgi:hypothetical protein